MWKDTLFVKLGTFYVAVGEDAVLVHKKLNLKCTCFKLNICKVGFPVIALEKYVEKLNEIKYGYVIYDYDEIADFMYRKLHKNNSTLIEGSLDSNGDVECKTIISIKQ